MAETTADVRRDIELTRNRISDTLHELEHKMNVAQIVKDNPWPALALAVGMAAIACSSAATPDRSGAAKTDAIAAVMTGCLDCWNTVGTRTRS